LAGRHASDCSRSRVYLPFSLIKTIITGFLGIDVCYVISRYLVTTIVVGQLDTQTFILDVFCVAPFVSPVNECYGRVMGTPPYRLGLCSALTLEACCVSWEISDAATGWIEKRMFAKHRNLTRIARVRRTALA
jgi:hypothetical protein